MSIAVLLANGVAFAYYGGYYYHKVSCQGGKCNGTAKNDKMLGTSKRDIMYAFKGSDLVYGKAANDDLFGFDGNDNLFGDDGNDKVNGSNNNDTLKGGNGSDTLNGGYGQDALYGETGNDVLIPGPNDDTSKKVLNGGAGNDQLKWGPANVTYTFEENWGADTISGSESAPDGYKLDFCRYHYWTSSTCGSGITKDLTINLNPKGDAPEVSDGANTVQWSNPKIRDIDSGPGDDDITGNDFSNWLWGRSGADTINAGDGDDHLEGGLGASDYYGYEACNANTTLDSADTLNGGAGNDTFGVSCGGDTMDGGPGDDQINPGKGSDTVSGGDGNDTIVVKSTRSSDNTSDADTVDGGAGDDTIEAQDTFRDSIDCGDGYDKVTYDTKLDTLTNCEEKTTILASGSGDDEFSTDDGVTWQDAYVLKYDSYYSQYGYAGYACAASYAPPIAGSAYISMSNNGGLCNAQVPQGITQYRTSFELPSGFTEPSMNIKIHADNYATIYLDGVEIGQQPQQDIGENYQGEPESFSVTDASLFQEGSNTLSFAVTNVAPGPTVLDYTAELTTK